MKKEILIDENNVEFFYDEDLNMWRLIETPHILEDTLIDFEIDLIHFENDVIWKDVENFIKIIKRDMNKNFKNIDDAKSILLILFQKIYANTFSSEILQNIDFTVSGIDYKGFCKNINLQDKYEYDYFFFPYCINDESRDVGTFVWRASFRDKLLFGVFCDQL